MRATIEDREWNHEGDQRDGAVDPTRVSVFYEAKVFESRAAFMEDVKKNAEDFADEEGVWIHEDAEDDEYYMDEGVPTARGYHTDLDMWSKNWEKEWAENKGTRVYARVYHDPAK